MAVQLAGCALAGPATANAAAVSRPARTPACFPSTTSAGGGEGDTGGTNPVPEASGDEILGTLGVAHSFGHGALFSFGLTRDKVGATQIRPGITLWFR